MKKYDLAALAQAPGKDLVEFIGQNDKVIAEVTTHVANLERLRGTSQAHALGYMEYMPDEVTMGDFDTHLSKKGHQMSMEALHTILLVAASAAVVAGIGFIAYKLFKAAQSKEPKSANYVEKAEQVQRMAEKLKEFRIKFAESAPATQEALKQRFLADSVKEAIVGMSDAELLNDTFVAYVRSEMHREQPSYLTAVARYRGEQSLFLNAALIYLEGVKESLEAFRREFLDVVSKAPDITDYQMVNLVNGLKWDRIDNGNHAGVQAVFAWAQAMGTPITNRVEETLKVAHDTLVAPITVDQVREYNPDIVAATIPKGGYHKLWALLKGLKDTGKYIEGAKGNFTQGEKRSQQVADLYKAQIARASQLADSVGIIEQMARAESDAIVRNMKISTNATKALLNAIEEVADKLEDKEQAKEIKNALDAITRATASGLSMKTEGLLDVGLAPISFGAVMALEGRNQWVEFLKSVAVVAAIGLAIYALQALVLSMLGLQSMAATFSGGVVYMQKNGKRITPGEAADIVADAAKDKRLGNYGVFMLAKNQNLPFKLTERHLGSGFHDVSQGVVESLRGFAGKLHGKPTDKDVINASKEGSRLVKRTIEILKGRLKDMSFNAPNGDPHIPATTHQLRDAMEAYVDQWFNPEKADYGLIKRGIDTTWFGVLDAKAEQHVDQNAKILTDGITNFSKSIPDVKKEDLKEMGEEAQEAHANFTQELAYMAALGHVVTELTKKAIRDGAMSMQAVRSQLKMRGEGIEGLDEADDAEDDFQPYEEPLDPMVDMAEAMGDLYVDEQSDVVMATENRKVMITRLLMTAGIVIILGAGAYMLLSMSQNRRKPNSFATDKMFKDIKRDLDASLKSEEFSARMKASTERFADDLQEDLKKFKARMDAARQPAGGKQTEKEVNGQRVDSGAAQSADVRPRIGETGSPVSGSNNASSVTPEGNVKSIYDLENADLMQIAKDADKLVENISKFDYKGPLRERLIERVPGMLSLNMACGSFDQVTRNVSTDREKRIHALSELTKHIMDNVVDPVFDVLNAKGDHEALAEKNYDGVVAAIAKAIEDATKEGLLDEIRMDEHQKTLDAFKRKSTEAEVDDAMKSFNPSCIQTAERVYLGEAKAYHNLTQELDTMMVENKDFMNVDSGARFNELKGNRDMASKLIRRLEEFKPTFNIIARAVRAHVNLSDVIFEAAEFTLRVHRSVQRELIKSVEFQAMKAAELKARLGGESATLDELEKAIDDLRNDFGSGK